MKLERISWIISVFVLISLALYIKKYRDDLRHTFIVHDLQQPYANDAISRFKKYENVDDKTVNKLFFISYLYESKKICIRLVPRPGVYGGSQVYCYAETGPIRLLSLERNS